MNAVKASLKYPVVTTVLTLFVFLAGLQALLSMPRREDPKITIRAGLVIALYPGASAEQVETQVAKKIEERLFRFAEVRKRKTFSTSQDGALVIQVELEDWVTAPDEFWSKLRHDLNELRQTDLPSGVVGPIVDSDFGDTVALLYAIRGDRYGYRELKGYLERIEDALRTVPAVSKLKRYGDQREEITITTTLERLAQYKVTGKQVIDALQRQNVVTDAGAIDADHTEVPLRMTGLFAKEDDIRRLMVDVSDAGRPVYLGDIADVRRRYEDPKDLARLDGKPALMLSVEMQEGNNIVDFGHAVAEKLAALKPLLPPDLEITAIADQPHVVADRVFHFNREFAIAILAVILVTMVLLPFRVAAIAAIAIPITIAVTFASLNAIGIELHQVSIAALIVVLGMVVDDAIVIADNYVELLDHGLPVSEAAWRSASDLAVPVLGATLTIVASFLPLAFLTGTVGEFIRSLPITVTVSLLCSYIVAMVLTPLLCSVFIKTGLHPHGVAAAPAGKKKFNALDAMQALYEKVMAIAMPHKWATMAFGVAAFVVGLVLLANVPDRFFPPAERDQFVIDVWMPEGTRLEATDEVVQRLERELKKHKDVVSFAAFVGASAPRFYYNISPVTPAQNFGQLVVNTTSPEITPEIVATLREKTRLLAPEARVLVKELEQGSASEAPIEVRIVGTDIKTLEKLGARVQAILDSTPGSAYLSTNYHEDAYRLAVDVRDDVANRFGLSKQSVAQQLAGSFSGAPVSTFWEGSRAVDLVLRVDESRRRSFDDVGRAYVTSGFNGSRVPLLEVASLRPVWEPSRIVRRNGIRTLTVRSFSDHGHLASAVLAKAMPQIEALKLPAGYRIEYGGELESQNETFAEMVTALMISELLIFLILLIQFRSAKMPLIIMVSIPLSLVGAGLGLMITGNPFSFTSFLGVISLTGVVVRNAIILVDYMNEERRKGIALETAAMEAGRRRLRPIFLTTAAAAAGVLPMIISGSGMWSPLASVIAVGLLCSMVFTLVIVPVLYVLANRGAEKSAPVTTEFSYPSLPAATPQLSH